MMAAPLCSTPVCQGTPSSCGRARTHAAATFPSLKSSDPQQATLVSLTQPHSRQPMPSYWLWQRGQVCLVTLVERPSFHRNNLLARACACIEVPSGVASVIVAGSYCIYTQQVPRPKQNVVRNGAIISR